MPLALECAFSQPQPTALEVWSAISTGRPDILSSETICSFSDQSMRVRDVADAIVSQRKHDFRVKLDRGYFHYISLGSYGISILQIAECIETVDDGALWVHILKDVKSFLQARLFNQEYELWQNVVDPLVYKTRGLPFDHLPMRNNGLPPPLNRQEIDTSANPGRRELRKGHVESVGSPLWLSSEMVRRIGLTEGELRAQQWLEVEFRDNVWKITAQAHPFDSDEGEQLRRQEKLRELLFDRRT